MTVLYTLKPILEESSTRSLKVFEIEDNRPIILLNDYLYKKEGKTLFQKRK